MVDCRDVLDRPLQGQGGPVVGEEGGDCGSAIAPVGGEDELLRVPGDLGRDTPLDPEPQEVPAPIHDGDNRVVAGRDGARGRRRMLTSCWVNSGGTAEDDEALSKARRSSASMRGSNGLPGCSDHGRGLHAIRDWPPQFTC